MTLTKSFVLVANPCPYVGVYQDLITGLALIKDGETKQVFSCHAGVSSKTEKDAYLTGNWKKGDRCYKVGSSYYFNIDVFINSSKYSALAAAYCGCPACILRKSKS